MTITCSICGETKQECRQNGDYTRVCGECQHKEYEREKQEYLDARATLSLEERVRAIEEAMYHQSKRHHKFNGLF